MSCKSSKNREEREDVNIDFERNEKGGGSKREGLDVAAARVALRLESFFHNRAIYVTFVR